MMREALPREVRIFVQVTQCAQAKDVPPSLPAVFSRIVEHMAALAQCGEIARQVVARIMVEMCAGEHDIGRTDAEHVQPFANRDPSTTVRTPIAGIGIPPSPVAKMRDEAQMRPRTSLAARTGTIETDRIRQLLPIDRVKPAVLGADRHDDSMSHRTGKRTRIIRHLLPLRIFFVPLRTPKGKGRSSARIGTIKALAM